MSQRIGLFGGSFDPIHRGHVAPVQDARRSLGLDRVIFLPTARPPHKPDRRFASSWARYAMVELTLLDEEGLFVSPHELAGDRPAYTVETVEAFRQRLPDAELSLVIGSDSFADLETWKRWRELVTLARLVVLVRPGWEPERLRPDLPSPLRDLMDRQEIDFVAVRPLPVSSTELRRHFARGSSPPADWIAEPVLRFIQKYDLYQ
ncbi:MAG: nicotinate-nucleotide adenylyltransferase [Acidobacteriota bacterium]